MRVGQLLECILFFAGAIYLVGMVLILTLAQGNGSIKIAGDWLMPYEAVIVLFAAVFLFHKFALNLKDLIRHLAEVTHRKEQNF